MSEEEPKKCFGNHKRKRKADDNLETLSEDVPELVSSDDEFEYSKTSGGQVLEKAWKVFVTNAFVEWIKKNYSEE
eukprot:12912467-Prorocentrum_lima.AAC.1